MLLTRRSLFLLLLTVLLLAGATFAPALLYVAGGYLFLVLAMFLADWRLTPSPRELEVVRVNDARLSLGAENLIRIRVTNRAWRAVRLIARDEYPPIFHSDQVILDSTTVSSDVPAAGSNGQPLQKRGAGARLVPRATVEFRYHVRPPRRGDYRFGDTNLRWGGVLGLVIRQARMATAAPVKVYPNLLDIRKYELLVRRGQLSEMGLHQMRVLGSGTQFERLREYQPDDEFRNIDWKATARRGKPIAREFETERSQNVIALLDVGRLMRSPVSDPLAAPLAEQGRGRGNSKGLELTKLDYAVNAVLMLSYVAGLRGDKVGLLAFADDVTRYLAPRSGRGQFYRMLALLYGVESEPVEANYTRAFAYLQARHKKRSLVVIFTDLAGGIAANEVVSQVAPLSPRHLPLLVAIGDPVVVQLAGQAPRDSASVYQRMVAEHLLDERALTMEALRQRGVLTLDVPADQLTISVVNKYLDLKARGRI
ncbi:MAG: DUF58 domain-containing protein [Anaerolineae bacterium]